MPLERASSTLFSSTSSPCRKILPESGFWKPQTIFISVDLPAPLSPSRPRTSPLRRCRLTSRSAVTGPKRLEMFSTRRTSSDPAPPPHPADVDVDHHRGEDRHAEDEVEVVRIDALERQP